LTSDWIANSGESLKHLAKLRMGAEEEAAALLIVSGLDGHSKLVGRKECVAGRETEVWGRAVLRGKKARLFSS